MIDDAALAKLHDVSTSLLLVLAASWTLNTATVGNSLVIGYCLNKERGMDEVS